MSKIEPKKNDTIQLLGFNPLELIEEIEFPNDRYEETIRRSKSARIRAIRRLPFKEVGVYSVVNVDHPTIIAPKPITAPRFKSDPIVDSNKTDELNRHELEELESKVKYQLSRMAAIITIQAFWKTILTRRKYLEVVCFGMTRKSIATTSHTMPGFDNLSDALSVQEKLLKKYHFYCQIYDRMNRLPPTYSFFCATLIQSYFRMWRLHQAYRNYRDAVALREAGLMLDELKRIGGNELVEKDEAEVAVRKVQKLWKSYYYRKIYKFFRDLIKFRQSGDPKKMLKFINPTESNLIDNATGLHIKFRLGGVNMNAFSPRDYTQECNKLRNPRVKFNKVDIDGLNDESKSSHDGWYQRTENNGWRPVSEKIYQEELESFEFSKSAAFNQISFEKEEKKINFHRDKLIRKEDVEKKRKEKKLKWLKKLYEDGKEGMGTKVVMENLDLKTVNEDFKSFEKDKGNCKTLTKEELEDFGINFENEEEDFKLLSNWSKKLDFEQYFDDWKVLATSSFTTTIPNLPKNSTGIFKKVVENDFVLQDSILESFKKHEIINNYDKNYYEHKKKIKESLIF
ncbi:hypothetical protein HDU92_005949 [Lobulomyces angularis]|nr:hypothetical protein HDU92_005949 [Lobulomyces angularis]